MKYHLRKFERVCGDKFFAEIGWRPGGERVARIARIAVKFELTPSCAPWSPDGYTLTIGQAANMDAPDNIIPNKILRMLRRAANKRRRKSCSISKRQGSGWERRGLVEAVEKELKSSGHSYQP